MMIQQSQITHDGQPNVAGAKKRHNQIKDTARALQVPRDDGVDLFTGGPCLDSRIRWCRLRPDIFLCHRVWYDELGHSNRL